MKKVKFIKNNGLYKAGSIISLNKVTADAFVKIGIAEHVNETEKPTKKTTKTNKK